MGVHEQAIRRTVRERGEEGEGGEEKGGVMDVENRSKW